MDPKKELKHLYNPSARKIGVVDVPEMSFLIVDGEGDPNISPEHREAVEALYAVSYTLKFMPRKGAAAVDYPVMPLEDLWWADDMTQFSVANKFVWKWTMMMIMHPEFVTEEMVEEAKGRVERKRGPVPASRRCGWSPYARDHRPGSCTLAPTPRKARRYASCTSLWPIRGTRCAASTTRSTWAIPVEPRQRSSRRSYDNRSRGVDPRRRAHCRMRQRGAPAFPAEPARTSRGSQRRKSMKPSFEAAS
nr:hypothetical protein [Rubrobacter marinus]